IKGVILVSKGVALTTMIIRMLPLNIQSKRSLEIVAHLFAEVNIHTVIDIGTVFHIRQDIGTTGGIGRTAIDEIGFRKASELSGTAVKCRRTIVGRSNAGSITSDAICAVVIRNEITVFSMHKIDANGHVLSQLAI